VVFTQTKDRKDIPEKYTWDLSIVYASSAEWQKAADKLKGDIEKFKAHKGRLSESAAALNGALKDFFSMYKDLYRVYSYASQISDQDLSVSANQELNQQANNIATAFSEATSFLRPEILALDAAVLKKFMSEEKGLSEYKMYLDDIQRMKEHTLSAREEEMLASFGLITSTPPDVFNVFTNSEMPKAEVTLSTGEKIKLDASAFTKYRTVDNQEDRKNIFDAYFTNFGKYKNTIANNFAGKLKADFVYAKNRNFTTALEASVSGPNVPVSVYENLIKQIHNSLPTLHKFLDMKKKMLGVDTLHYYDLYTPLVKEVDMDFTIEEGQEVILNALKPMGDEYQATLKKAFSDRWIDYFPNTGKKSGAYSNGAVYDVHPYILMNWTDDFESVSTLAHELGHTMHSYFSNKTQPFQTSDYATFVAEIASTFNENLLNNYMTKNVKTNEEKMYLLGSYLELLRTTIFRQTMFAEFEWEVHKLVEANKPVTGEILSDLYYGIVKTYYGHDKGVCIVDPSAAYEWAYIPHFVNYTYYVYQYATSLIYATAIAEKVIAEGQPAVEKYYNILKGGSSDYPLELIKKAGIDPLSSEAFELTMKKMNSIMAEMEKLSGK
jgi:oligoendopeptidase F